MGPCAKFCDHCGKPVAVDAGFCAACGGQLVPGPVLADDIPGCPRCGKNGLLPEDALLEVQAFLNRADYSRKELKQKKNYEACAQYLAPPKKPRPFSLLQYLFLMCIPVINVLSVFMSPLNTGLKALVALIGAVFAGCILWAANTNRYVDSLPHDVTMTVGTIFFLVYFICLLWTWFAQKARIRRDVVPHYHESLARWPHIRCCLACHRVYYDDRPGQSAPVRDIESFLREN